jgi:predicted tellurium resistance membrane protein TerC
MTLTQPLFTVMETGYSYRALVLFFGGLFLLAKSTIEIHNSVEPPFRARKR